MCILPGPRVISPGARAVFDEVALASCDAVLVALHHSPLMIHRLQRWRLVAPSSRARHLLCPHTAVLGWHGWASGTRCSSRTTEPPAVPGEEGAPWTGRQARRVPRASGLSRWLARAVDRSPPRHEWRDGAAVGPSRTSRSAGPGEGGRRRTRGRSALATRPTQSAKGPSGPAGQEPRPRWARMASPWSSRESGWVASYVP